MGINEYIELVDKVWELDQDAAWYLMNNALKLKPVYSKDLAELFAWYRTPQGTEFWADLYNKLGGTSV